MILVPSNWNKEKKQIIRPIPTRKASVGKCEVNWLLTIKNPPLVTRKKLWRHRIWVIFVVPLLEDWIIFVIKVGRMSAARACLAGIKILNPDKKIIGIANPTAPFTRPAKKPIPKLIRRKRGFCCRKSNNISS